jgi:hypothetical protein
MPRCVWKFPLEHRHTIVLMPKGAKVLTVHEQHGKIGLWAEVDPYADHEKREFIRVPTGGNQDITDHHRYIGTVFLEGGKLVWHIYEVG